MYRLELENFCLEFNPTIHEYKGIQLWIFR